MPKERKYYVTAELTCRDDADALADILSDLGTESTISYRSLVCDRPSPTRDTRLGRCVLRYLREHKHGAHYTDVADHVEVHEFRRGSASAALSLMMREGDVERIERGVYRMRKNDE